MLVRAERQSRVRVGEVVDFSRGWTSCDDIGKAGRDRALLNAYTMQLEPPGRAVGGSPCLQLRGVRTLKRVQAVA